MRERKKDKRIYSAFTGAASPPLAAFGFAKSAYISSARNEGDASTTTKPEENGWEGAAEMSAALHNHAVTRLLSVSCVRGHI